MSRRVNLARCHWCRRLVSHKRLFGWTHVCAGEYVQRVRHSRGTRLVIRFRSPIYRVKPLVVDISAPKYDTQVMVQRIRVALDDLKRNPPWTT